MPGANHFFPSPLPGETLFSICSRYHVLSGNPSPLKTREDLKCPRNFFGFLDLPTKISQLISETVLKNRISADELTIKNTNYPYFQPFLTEQQNAELITLISTGKHPKRRITLSIKAQIRCKYCVHCVNDDLSRHGVSYWHREHQLPGVFVCPTHNTPLRFVPNRYQNKVISGLLLPEATALNPISQEAETKESLQLLTCIAKRTLDYLNHPSMALMEINEGIPPLRKNFEILTKTLASLPPLGEYLYFRPRVPDSFPAKLQKALHRPFMLHRPFEFILLRSIADVVSHNHLIN
ncbi:TniQ family protein [Pseudomonas sp. PDM18]|uniref:TniQ domain-containing protein n=1 Tax=Pseudomonas nitroreducens TaxID=46680 RepID=A0A5R9AHK6_PSENT|nr:TniQ family protein [Pseudomonas sp. PDM18]TLP77654.1 hypothetical protein FEA48_00210 [Pseudomonas nitroreducens]